MKTKIIVLLVVTVCLASAFVASAQEVSVKLEAEGAGGNYVVVDAAAASGGKYIGIDHTLNEENKNNYYLIYEDVPAINSIKMIYATGAAVDATVVIYVEEGGQNKEVGTLIFTNSGGWDPIGETMLTSVKEGLDIAKGSKVTLIATGSVNIDYFEFIGEEPQNPQTNDSSSILMLFVFAILASCLIVKRNKNLVNL